MSCGCGGSSSVSRLVASNPLPQGNADTITNALAPFPNAGVRGAVYAAASTGEIPAYNEPSCSGAGIQNSDYIGSIGAAAAKNLFPSIPIIGGVLSGIVGAFGAHHAAAVKQEQAVLCAEVPGIIAFLRSVDAAVLQGADPDTASRALDSAYATFEQRTQIIFKSCNAACDYRKYVRAAIEFRKQNYALMVAQNAKGAQGVLGGVVNAVTGAVNYLLPTTPGASPAYAAAGILGAGGFTLNSAQAKLAMIFADGSVFVGGIVFIVSSASWGARDVPGV